MHSSDLTQAMIIEMVKSKYEQCEGRIQKIKNKIENSPVFVENKTGHFCIHPMYLKRYSNKRL